MAKDPRPHQPGSSEPDEALELLRALARSRGGGEQPQAPESAASGDEKLDALRELAEKLDLQLRGSPAQAPGPPPLRPGAPPPDMPPTARPAPSPPPPPVDDETPARPVWHARLGQALRGEWRALVAALPEAGTLVPRFAGTQIVFIGISVGVLLIAALGGIVGVRKPQVAPVAQSQLAAITKEMEECDAAAAKQPDALYFYLLPLLPSKGAEGNWRTLSEVGESFHLLSGKDALDSLREGKLTVRPGRYTFAVRDTAGGQTYSWTSATGAARLSRPVSADVKSLRLGFDFTPGQTGTTTWSNEFKRDPGTCYWVSVLVRP